MKLMRTKERVSVFLDMT